MSELQWQPSDGGERAEANGFSYEIAIGPYTGNCHVTIRAVDFMVLEKFSVLKDGKEFCESHANAITADLSSKASTIDVEACAKELIGKPDTLGIAYNACLREVQDVIRKHLQPASESAWISVEERLPERNFGEVEVAIYPNSCTWTGYHDGAYWMVYRLTHKHAIERGNVTHWMPKPQPPARKEG